jgi:hypothetical protein
MAERRGLLLGARILTGVVATGVAVLTIGVVALVPFPTVGAAPRTVTVDPAPADQVRVCPGGAIRLGDESGADAAAVFAIGSAQISAVAQGGTLDRTRLTSADANAGAASAPEELRLAPGDGALLAGAQLQDVDAPDFRGLTAASCAEPSGSIWLVGGAMTVGRTTALLLSNPTEVPSRVNVEIYGEDGTVTAPGMTGIDVPAQGQRVVSLAGFAPGVASPVVHVSARGGRVVATLQQSIVRGLDAVGVETIGAGADPATSIVIPGVRIADAIGVNRASALADWQDVIPALRVLAPGDLPANVTVRVVPVSGSGESVVGASFQLEVDAGIVSEIPLDAGGAESGAAPDATQPDAVPADTAADESAADDDVHGLQDGVYTVFVDADQPIVAGVRASTAVDSGQDAGPDQVLSAPPSDVAWFSAAPALDDSGLVVVPAGPNPVLTIANPTTTDIEVSLTPAGGGESEVVGVPAGGSVAIPVAAGGYRLDAAAGVSVGVSFAASGALASFVVSPARPVAGSIVVHPG